jgi:hypothetical protein
MMQSERSNSLSTSKHAIRPVQRAKSFNFNKSEKPWHSKKHNFNKKHLSSVTNMSVQAYVQISVKDAKTGKLIRKGRMRKAHSFVLPFLQILDAQGGLSGNITITDTGGVNRSLSAGATANSPMVYVNAGVGVSTSGIVVGTGIAAPANTDNKLQTQIAHGAGAGQLNYGAQSETAAAVVSTNVDWILTRTFTNASGGTVTINELALYAALNANGWFFCVLHDAQTQAVNNGQVATVTYTLRTTV